MALAIGENYHQTNGQVHGQNGNSSNSGTESGCSLAWFRTSACHVDDPGSNPGNRTITLFCQIQKTSREPKLLGYGMIPADDVFGQLETSLSKSLGQLNGQRTQHERRPSVETSGCPRLHIFRYNYLKIRLLR